MKILKQGDITKAREPELVGYHVVCEKCGCEYIINLNETETYLIMGGFTGRQWHCPCCDNEQDPDYRVGMKKCESIYE